jgi:hypothetical protein
MKYMSLLTVFLCACGQNLPQSEAVTVRLVTGESSGDQNSSEDFLGIKAKKSSDQGALTSLSQKKGGEPAKVDQAFGS